MIIEFSVGNYRSFKDIKTLSMVAAKIKSKNKELDTNNVFPLTDKVDLLKSAVIYGANASGKSNFIKALKFMDSFVSGSTTDYQSGDPIPVDKYRLSTETDNKPSHFEIVFFHDQTKYRYGFEVDSRKIHSEWLYYTPNVRESKLFVRSEDEIFRTSVFKEGKGLYKKTRENALFISVVAQFNGKISIGILEWFQNLGFVSGITDNEHKVFTMGAIQSGLIKNETLSFIKEMDLGIMDLNVVKKKSSALEIKRVDELVKDAPEDDREDIKEYLLRSKNLNVNIFRKRFGDNNLFVDEIIFDIEDDESEGTKKLFYFLGPVFYSLKFGFPLIVDELDARFHPLITRSIINLFNSNKTNPNNAQLIFATHDTNLLNKLYFRRDQIWFTEKDKYGATDLYSLAEIKVRNDASFEKDYILGRYGAIPFIGDVSHVLHSEN